jgi:hypothetical protein
MFLKDGHPLMKLLGQETYFGLSADTASGLVDWIVTVRTGGRGRLLGEAAEELITVLSVIP